MDNSNTPPRNSSRSPNNRSSGKPDRKPFRKSDSDARGRPEGKSWGKPGGKPGGKAGDKSGDKFGEKRAFKREDRNDRDRPDRGNRGARSDDRPNQHAERQRSENRSQGRDSRGPTRNDDRTSRTGHREPEDFVYPDEPKGVAVRRAAVDILDIVRSGESLDDALSQCRSYYALGAISAEAGSGGYSRADRGFARAMATTVLRRRGTIDHLIGPYLDKPLPAKAARIMDILRVSAAQSLFLDTPAHAAVSLATALAKERRETAGYAALVNAIARKLSNVTPEKLADLPVRLDSPAWLWRGWERNYGPAISRKIAAAHLNPAPLDITVHNRDERAHWVTALDADPHNFNADTTSLRLKQPPSDLTNLPGFAEGKWWVQDFSAHLPVHLLGNVAGKSVVDLCAAPGGKTLQLAASGANVIAVDRSAGRMARLVENLERTKLSARTRVADALDFQPDSPVDIVLLDAPCTATGTIRRHPDIPWVKSQDEVTSMAQVQTRMIDHALTMLKPGGMLVYCTCSLQAEEGEQQIIALLKRNDRVTRQAFVFEDIPSQHKDLIPAVNRHGDIRLLPFMLGGAGGVDGFFISRLVIT